jgi:hypothetical protein
MNMPEPSDVFEKTYRDYLEQIKGFNLESFKQKLGVEVQDDEVIIPLYGEPYRVSENGIIDPSGKQPSLEISVILFKYLLLCPDTDPTEKDWVSYRDLKDSGPLTVYFANDVERAIAGHFKGALGGFEEAGKAIGGYRPDIDVSYDLCMQFDALPKVPVIVLFNDADDEFPAQCSLLFERRAESYLDAECLAMIGRLLLANLKRATRKVNHL